MKVMTTQQLFEFVTDTALADEMVDMYLEKVMYFQQCSLPLKPPWHGECATWNGIDVVHRFKNLTSSGTGL